MLSQETKTKRILHADDHPAVRGGARLMLEDTPHIEIVAEAENGAEAVRLTHELAPDLVLMDVRMPVMDGLSATRQLKREVPNVPVLMYTTHEDPDYILEAIRAGAAGYVLKDADAEEFVEMIDAVLAGEQALSAALTTRLLATLAKENYTRSDQSLIPGSGDTKTKFQPASHFAERLTAQETSTLKLLALGMSNTEIGTELRLSPHTVKTYVERIIKKLEVSDRTQAAVRAVTLGIVEDHLYRN